MMEIFRSWVWPTQSRTAKLETQVLSLGQEDAMR